MRSVIIVVQLCPDEAVYKELRKNVDKDNFDLDQDPSPLKGSDIQIKHNISPDNFEAMTTALRTALQDKPLPPPLPDDEDEMTLVLADNMQRMTFDPTEFRFFGKSSGAMLISTALELKNVYNGTTNPEPSNPFPLHRRRKEFWTLQPVSAANGSICVVLTIYPSPQWEQKKKAEQLPQKYSFPEPGLMDDLIELYFERVNLYLPLLHRPTFKKLVEDCLHHENDGFACVLLLVCAVGSRASDDPRVLLDDSESHHSAGWKWFDQVQMMRRSLLSPPTLYDLQFYCVSLSIICFNVSSRS